MTPLKAVRYGAWVLVALVVGVIAYLQFGRSDHAGPLQLSPAAVGGSFNLVRDDGTPISEKDLLGKPHALFFGFTHCPEICPTTLYEAQGWIEALGEDASNFAVYFISVDPERDTPQMLSEYMSAFDNKIVGITGDPEAIAEVLKLYKVFARKVPLDAGDYTMDHTATVYLMDAQGKFTGTIGWGENPDAALEKIRRLVKDG